MGMMWQRPYRCRSCGRQRELRWGRVARYVASRSLEGFLLKCSACRDIAGQGQCTRTRSAHELRPMQLDWEQHHAAAGRHTGWPRTYYSNGTRSTRYDASKRPSCQS